MEAVRMTRPRSALISLEATPYYHCIMPIGTATFLGAVDLQVLVKKKWDSRIICQLGQPLFLDEC
jgi:hypothetical protein